MSCLSDYDIRKLGRFGHLITPFKEENVTPQGYDFSLKAVYSMVGQGYLGKDQKRLPDYVEIKFDFSDRIFLMPGFYLIEFEETVSLPSNRMAIMHPRSSLLRMGATLETAVWDAGYTGLSKTILHVLNPSGISFERGVRIGHMTFHELTDNSSGYKGQYQGEVALG